MSSSFLFTLLKNADPEYKDTYYDGYENHPERG